MERLTSRQIIHDESTGKDFTQTYIFGHKWGPAYFKRGTQDYDEYNKLLDRLAAYEDTGLTPGEMESVLDKYGRRFTAKTAFMDELQAYRALGTLEELTALVKAKAEGLALALPCKVGDEFYTIDYEFSKCHLGYDFDEYSCQGCEDECDSNKVPVVRAHKCATLSQQADFIGRPIFLTRSEAEAALEGGQKS